MKKLYLLILTLVLAGALSAQVTCYDIQYTTAGDGNSPYYGQTVTVEGIVTSIHMSGERGIHIADVGGGEWHGLYVYDYDVNYVWECAIGDMVSITGEVDEWYGETEIKNLTAMTINSSGNAVHAPLLVETEAFGEKHEGVFCIIENLTVTEAPDGYGQWTVENESGITFRLDDNCSYISSEADPWWVYPEIEAGDEFDAVQGIVSYNYDEYKLNPRTLDDFNPVTGINGSQKITAVSRMSAVNTPNPFNPNTTITFTIPEASNVQVDVYNVMGSKISTLVNRNMERGSHSVNWNGTDDNGMAVSSGIYFYTITTANESLTQKMILVK